MGLKRVGMPERLNTSHITAHLPGDSVTFHRLRAQSHKTIPTPLQMPVISSRSPGYPQLLFNLATNWRFP